MSDRAIAPPMWTTNELDAAREEAIMRFRKERLGESLEAYLRYFDQYETAARQLLDTTSDLTALEPAMLEVISDDELAFVFRYLAGPPLSEDDLQVVADVPSLAASRLREQPDDLERLRSAILAALDPRRFPWVEKGTAPTESERHLAVRTTAALIATQRLATSRRMSGQKNQEQGVKDALKSVGFVEIPRRHVRTMREAPQPGEFCGEAKLSDRKADFIVGLHDGRVLAIECKVSNSYLNSIKRLNNDAAVKAVAWRKDLGETQVVAAAVLSGVFKLANLEQAQGRGLAIFWAHELKPMLDWIASTDE